jgi:hypothetical protein
MLRSCLTVGQRTLTSHFRIDITRVNKTLRIQISMGPNSTGSSVRNETFAKC